MRVFLDRLYLFAGYLAGAFMIAIFLLMMALSAGRPVGLNIPAADDFVSWDEVCVGKYKKYCPPEAQR